MITRSASAARADRHHPLKTFTAQPSAASLPVVAAGLRRRRPHGQGAHQVKVLKPSLALPKTAECP